MLWISSCWMVGAARWAPEGDEGTGEGQVGLTLSASLAKDTRLLLDKARSLRVGRVPVLGTGASLAQSWGHLPCPCISHRQIG